MASTVATPNLFLAPVPDDESARMEELHDLGVLDTGGDPLLDAVVELAAMICETPVSLVSHGVCYPRSPRRA